MSKKKTTSQVEETGPEIGEMKEVEMPITRQQWLTKPSGDDLDHVLTITINMTDTQRYEVEDLNKNFWDFKCRLYGYRKPQQMGLGFDGENQVEQDESEGE